MIGTQPPEIEAGTEAPLAKKLVLANMETDGEAIEDETPATEPATMEPKADPTVETFQLPDELMALKDTSLPALVVKPPPRKLTEDEREALHRKEALFRLIEKAGVFTNWVTQNLEQARLEMLAHKETEADGSAAPEAEVPQPAVEEPVEEAKEVVDSPKPKGKKKKSSANDDESPAPTRSVRGSTAASTAATTSAAQARKRKSPDADGEASATPKKAKAAPKKAKALAMAPSDPESKVVMYPELPPRLKPRQPNLVTGGIMRDYQLVGTEWLITLYENGFNGILADEMGLGKTIQTIAFLAHLRAMNVQGFVLVVGPLSVLDNWISELNRFAPLLNVARYHGNPTDRQHMREKWQKLPEHERPIIVTSYEIAIRDRPAFQHFTFKYLIVDEGHRLKNMDSKLLRDLKSLTSESRLLLTGTPLQNNLAELWALLNFCLPEVFTSLREFQAWFDFETDLSEAGGDASIMSREEKDKVITHLHTVLRPFLLRRVKTDVEESLPKKKEYLVYAPLTPYQRTLYQAALTGSQALRTELQKRSNKGKEDVASETASVIEVDDGESDSGGSSADAQMRRSKRAAAQTLSATGRYNVDTASESAIGRSVAMAMEKKEAQKLAAIVAHKEMAAKVGRGSLNNLLMQLRKICNHPYLFQGTEDEDEKESLDDSGDEALASNVRKQIESSKNGKKKEKIPDIVAKSGKLLLLERLLPALFARGHKVLIFSQMVNILYILQEWFEDYKGWKCSRLDGGVSLDDRKIAIDNFNNDPETNLFLLSTRAGGLGINLVAADTVILFDSDWNPQADLQAQDRAHRIGQTKPVVVYRLVTEGTVEAKILEKARSKRKLEKLVMQGGAMRALPGQKSLLGKANLTVEDLAHALFSTDAESVRFSKSAEGDIPDPKSLISDDELAYLLDRSFNDRTEGPEGEASKGKGKGKSPAKKGAKASPVRPGAAARFEEVAEGEWRDENGDALADHDAAALGKI